MDRRRAAGALLALAACIACSTAAPTASNQTALDIYEGPSEGCYYNFQHYGEGDRIMTNEPCLNCTCHNKMLMCYLKVCPFTKPIGQDCTIEKRADQCCPIVTCPDVPVDLLTSTSTSSPAEYGATGLGKVDKYGCSINGKYFSEGSKVPPTPNKPCEHCYCIRNMTTCVMQECTLHVDGCTPIYHKDVCCPVRYSCDHLEDEMLLLDDMTTTVRPTPGFLLTTTTMPSVTQASQNCVHDDQIFADGALIKTEIACEHCYCMKGDIVCVVQECGTPMENEGKNCTSLPPRQGQCCPDTYICEGDELLIESTTGITYEELTTSPPPRRVEGSGYRNEPDEPYTDLPTFEGSGEEHATTLESSDMFTSQKQTPQIIDEVFAATEESLKPDLMTFAPDKEQNTVPDDSIESTSDSQLLGKTTLAPEVAATVQPTAVENMKDIDTIESKTTVSDYRPPSEADSFISTEDELIMTTESASRYTKDESKKITEEKPEIDSETTETFNVFEEVTTQQTNAESSKASTVDSEGEKITTSDVPKLEDISQPSVITSEAPKGELGDDQDTKYTEDLPLTHDVEVTGTLETTTYINKIQPQETTSINPVENEIDEDVLPPGRIPGEGDCLLNGVTYKNNTNVPNINNCHSSCKCVSSIVKCDPILCSPPPEHMDNMNDCQPIYDTPDACCPTYVCHSRETIPPESHSQMSGTESPKPSLENECDGEQCQPHKTKPVSPELCNSGNCDSEVLDHDTKCTDGACEPTETNITTSPLCIGDSCPPSVNDCTDGKCQPPITSEITCDSESGCQPSESCEGNNCVVASDITITTNDLPVCKDSEDCKETPSDTSNKDAQVSNENITPSECTEESCRRKEQPQENKTPLQCSDSSCIQEVESKLSASTTESTVQDQVYKEPTTETSGIDYPKLPESQTTSENVEIPEQSTDKSEGLPVDDLHQPITERGESNSDTTETQTMKTEETITEIYNKPETEYHKTDTPDIDTPKTAKPVTETSDIIKDLTTDAPLTTKYEEHSSDLSNEAISGKPSNAFETSTETLDTEPHDYEKNKEDITDTNIIEDITEVQETSTKSTNILATTSKLLETEVTEQNYPKKQEKPPVGEFNTESNEILQQATEKQEISPIIPVDDKNIESQPDIAITESYVTLSDTSTESRIDFTVKHDDVTPTEVFAEITTSPEQLPTEQSVHIQESSVPPETKLEETATKKIIDEAEKDDTSTEHPSVYTEVISSETTSDGLYETDKKPESPTDAEVPVNVDVIRITTESLIKDQEDLSKTTETYEIVTDKKDNYTTRDDSQEYVTTVSSIIHATEPSAVEEKLVTETQDIPFVEQSESNASESSMKEVTTQGPITYIEEKTTEPTNMEDISSHTVSDTIEDHTDTSIKDFTEMNYVTPKETLQDDKTHEKSPIIGTQGNAITTDTLPVHETEITTKSETIAELGTTVSSVSSHQNEEETTTKSINIEPDKEPSKETTVLPKEQTTGLDEITSVDTETKTSDTSMSSEVQSEEVTTESLIKPTKDESKLSDFAPSIDESTSEPVPSYTENHADFDDKTISILIDEDKPLYTTPDTITQFTEKQETTEKEEQLTDTHVTEDIMNDIKVIDSNEDRDKPTDHTTLNEMKHQDVVTNAPEITTQSQDTETELPTAVHTNQDMLTSDHVTKEEKGQTESPMSLVTEPLETIHSEDNDLIIEKTTEAPKENVPAEEDIKSSDYDKPKPPIPYTESPQVSQTEIQFDSEMLPQTRPEEESKPESPVTSLTPEHTTDIALDVSDKEKTPPGTENAYSTDVVEKLVPTTEFQEISTSAPAHISHEYTSVPVIVSSEESSETGVQDASTKYSEPPVSPSTVTYDHELNTKPENIPVNDHSLEYTTELPQYEGDLTTQGSKTSEMVNEDHGDSQQGNDQMVDVQETEHTMSPELLTTKYPETLENQDKPTDELEPNKHEEPFLPSEEQTTENIITVDQTMSPDIHIQTPIDQNQNKFTEILQTSDEKDITTVVYQDLVTPKEDLMPNIPESIDILTTESSEILPSEDNNRRTLSPDLEPIQTGQYTTEKLTESQETTKSADLGQADITPEISSKAPEKESTTSMDEEFDHVTSIPQVTEGNIVSDTASVALNQDQIVPVVTESIDEHSTEVQHITLRPDTELEKDGEVHTEIPYTSVTEKIETTVYEDLIKIPEETTLSEHTASQELQTESSIPKETESEISVPIETDTTIPKATESSILKETETVAPKLTEESVPEVTEASVPKVTEAAVPEVTEVFVPEVTEASVPEVTEASIPEVNEASVPEVTEGSVPEVTGASVPEVTEASVPEVTEASVPEVTKASVPEETKASVPEDSVPKVTEVSVPKVTELSLPEITETSVPKVTDSSVPEVTETSESEVTEASVPEVTEETKSEVTEASISKVTEASVSEITEASVSIDTETPIIEKAPETSMSKATEAPVSEEIKTTISEVSEDSVPEENEKPSQNEQEVSTSETTEAYVTESSYPKTPESSEPEIPETSVSETSKPKTETTETSEAKVTEASEAVVTEAFAPEVTEASIPEATESSISKVTEAKVPIDDISNPKVTEVVVMNEEPEGTTFKPKHENADATAEQSPTHEPTYSSSETTPYLVELQEHTTKVDEDFSSITTSEEVRTNAPETYQTERGDQPLDNLPDKFTQHDSHEEHTTKETFTKKDEQLNTLPPDQASEHAEIIPDKTEVGTEEVSVPSESPVTTLSDIEIGQHTTSHDEQRVTIPPTISVTLKENETFATAILETETTTKKDLLSDSEKIPEHDITQETTISEDALIPLVTKATTTKLPEEITTRLPIAHDKFTKPEDKPSETYSPTAAPELPKPGINEIQSTEEVSPPDFPPSGSSGYGQEPDYVEEDQAFGPGTCRYGGKVYVSAQQIPRDDPCDFCFCFRSDIICLQQSCPPPIHGCHEEPIQGFCCPRYECPVSMATTLNVTTTTTTTTTTLPPHFLPHAYKGAAQRRGCQIKGHSYKVGEVVRASSGPCLHCTCGGDGQMKCDPKACTPEPMLRQMIAAAVSAKRRR